MALLELLLRLLEQARLLLDAFQEVLAADDHLALQRRQFLAQPLLVLPAAARKKAIKKENSAIKTINNKA